MLKWALIFFLVSVVAGVLGFANVSAGVLGFANVSAGAAGIAKVLFVLALIGFLIILVFGVMLGKLVL